MAALHRGRMVANSQGALRKTPPLSGVTGDTGSRRGEEGRGAGRPSQPPTRRPNRNCKNYEEGHWAKDCSKPKAQSLRAEEDEELASPSQGELDPPGLASCRQTRSPRRCRRRRWANRVVEARVFASLDDDGEHDPQCGSGYWRTNHRAGPPSPSSTRWSPRLRVWRGSVVPGEAAPSVLPEVREHRGIAGLLHPALMANIAAFGTGSLRQKYRFITASRVGILEGTYCSRPTLRRRLTPSICHRRRPPRRRSAERRGGDASRHSTFSLSAVARRNGS